MLLNPTPLSYTISNSYWQISKEIRDSKQIMGILKFMKLKSKIMMYMISFKID